MRQEPSAESAKSAASASPIDVEASPKALDSVGQSETLQG